MLDEQLLAMQSLVNNNKQVTDELKQDNENLNNKLNKR